MAELGGRSGSTAAAMAAAPGRRLLAGRPWDTAALGWQGGDSTGAGGEGRRGLGSAEGGLRL